jgi:hypothetical protein
VVCCLARLFYQLKIFKKKFNVRNQPPPSPNKCHTPSTFNRTAEIQTNETGFKLGIISTTKDLGKLLLAKYIHRKFKKINQTFFFQIKALS